LIVEKLCRIKIACGRAGKKSENLHQGLQRIYRIDSILANISGSKDKFVKRFISFLPLALLLSAKLTTATPVSVGVGAFDASATIIDFNSFSDGTLLTTQFVGLGLVVSGGLYADSTNSGLFFGSPSASDFVPTNSGPGPYNIIDLTFNTPITLVGMDEISNVGSFNITSAGGTLLYSSSLTPGFAGYEDPAGFASITLTVTGALNNAFGIDNLRFEAVPVSEPGLASMLSGTIALLGCVQLARELLSRS
jgi:hypothetical protein